MSILITSIAVAGGLLLAKIAAIVASGRGKRASMSSDKKEPRSSENASARAIAAPRDPIEGFACHLGDVVLRAEGDEAWLAGGLIFSERERALAVLFIAPDAGGDRAIYATPDSSAPLLWLRTVAAKDLALGGDPPTALEIGETRFERHRRLPLRASRIGSGAPDVGPHAIVAEYTSASGERLVVVAGTATHAWRGALLEPGMYEVIPSGKSTL